MPRLDVDTAYRVSVISLKWCKRKLHVIAGDNAYIKQKGQSPRCRACFKEWRLMHDGGDNTEYLKQQRREYQINTRDHRSRLEMDRYRKDRLLVFDHYGWKCRCCGFEDERYLELDHINGDGYVERTSGGYRMSRQYTRVARQFRRTGQWPEDRQVLCAWCNSQKGNAVKCPCGARDQIPGQLVLWED